MQTPVNPMVNQAQAADLDHEAHPNPAARPSQTVGRFAPSPSGRMHLGNAFSCLMAWLSAKSQEGRVVLRIEDLDERTRDPQKAADVMSDLEWLGLPWDEGPYYQSKRLDIYAEKLERLTTAGLTYPCFCTRSELHAASAPHASDGTYIYLGTCRNLTDAERAERAVLRPPATRLRVPQADDPAGTFDFCDLAYGPQREVLAIDCGDFLIRRSDGIFAYQLAVSVDDGLMGINQVVRGRDLLSSSARQMYLADCLGLPRATYGHVPLLVAPDGRRLSKRDRDLDLGALRKKGIDPRIVTGWLAWAAGLKDNADPATPEELTELFSWSKLANAADIAVPSSLF